MAQQNKHSFILRNSRGEHDMGFVYACSGYLVEGGRVLLVHHRGWDMWVPPGGHLEPGDTFARAAEREFKEETGLEVEAISSQPMIEMDDGRNLPEPVPFFVDLEHHFEPNPGIVQFFWVRRTKNSRDKEHSAQAKELHGVDWFSAEQIERLNTFDQVKKLAKYSLQHHPDA